jgi:hypothetical protein
VPPFRSRSSVFSAKRCAPAARKRRARGSREAQLAKFGKRPERRAVERAARLRVRREKARSLAAGQRGCAGLVRCADRKVRKAARAPCGKTSSTAPCRPRTDALLLLSSGGARDLRAAQLAKFGRRPEGHAVRRAAALLVVREKTRSCCYAAAARGASAQHSSRSSESGQSVAW